MSKPSKDTPFNAREIPAYREGVGYFRDGMQMAESSNCPHPMGSGDRRCAWMLGFFDAYFQALCDRKAWGSWLPTATVMFALLLSGCVQVPSEQNGPVKPVDDRKPAPVNASLESLAYESFQARDRVRAEKLRKLADDIAAGRVKYIAAINQGIRDAGNEAATTTWKPVQDKLGEIVPASSTEAQTQADLAKAEKAVRDLAAAAERAGGGK